MLLRMSESSVRIQLSNSLLLHIWKDASINSLVCETKRSKMCDEYCWKCKKKSATVKCSNCIRSFHKKCIDVKNADNYLCPECTRTDTLLSKYSTSSIILWIRISNGYFGFSQCFSVFQAIGCGSNSSTHQVFDAKSMGKIRLFVDVSKYNLHKTKCEPNILALYDRLLILILVHTWWTQNKNALSAKVKVE